MNPDPDESSDEEVQPPSSTEPKQDEPVIEPAEDADKEDTETKAETEEDEPPKKSSGYARLKARHQAVIAELEALKNPPQQAEVPKEPKPEDFNGDYLAYEKAAVAFVAERAIEKGLAKARQQDFQEREAHAREEIVQEFIDEAPKFAKSIPDFDTSIDNMNKQLGPIPPVLRDMIADPERVNNRHMLVYHLSKNLGLAKELYQSDPITVAMEIGRLDEKLTLPKTRSQTKAPPPITPARGGASPPKDIFALAKSDDITDYVRQRNLKKD